MSRVLGIDVSEWQGNLDWKALKASGVKFAVIRMGYGDYNSSGKLNMDEKFPANIKACEDNNIPYGVYYFCYAKNLTEVQKECEHAKNLINTYCKKKPFMVSYDFEYDTVTKAANKGITLGKAQFNSFCQAWGRYFTALGYKCPVYLNWSYYNNWYDKAKLGQYGLWVAYYQSSCFVNDYSIWQFSSTYSIGGIKFDANYADTSFVNATTSVSTQPVKPTPTTPAVNKKEVEEVQTYKNGSTVEICYADTACNVKTGSLNAYETCDCIGKCGNLYVVRYKVDGTNTYKVGLVKYHGGTKF